MPLAPLWDIAIEERERVWTRYNKTCDVNISYRITEMKIFSYESKDILPLLIVK